MSFTQRELVNFFREQVKLEEEVVRSINQVMETITNPVVKGVLRGVSFDSLKHAEIYKAAIQLSSVTPALTEDEYNQLKAAMEKHIENEEEIIEHLKQAIDKTENDKIRFLLESIASDENRHHELLQKIMDIIVRGETITEDDWWELLWRDVPFHGAPGG